MERHWNGRQAIDPSPELRRDACMENLVQPTLLARPGAVAVAEADLAPGAGAAVGRDVAAEAVLRAALLAGADLAVCGARTAAAVRGDAARGGSGSGRRSRRRCGRGSRRRWGSRGGATTAARRRWPSVAVPKCRLAAGLAAAVRREVPAEAVLRAALRAGAHLAVRRARATVPVGGDADGRRARRSRWRGWRRRWPSRRWWRRPGWWRWR